MSLLASSARSNDESSGGPPRKTKRQGFIAWKEYVMGLALLAQQRSKDPDYQVGACIVNKDNFVVGIGYNGMPLGCSDDKFPWSEKKHLYVCHAEMNAILYKFQSDIKGCTMYVTRFPCNECVKIIIQSGISEVVYLRIKNPNHETIEASKTMMDAANIKYSQYVPTRSKIEIDFTIGNEQI